MGRKKAILFVVIGVLIIVLSAELFLYLKYKQTIPNTQQEKSVLNPPAELSDNFDPTINSPVFKIESINAGKKSLGLKFVYPPSLEGTSVAASLITCKDDDVKINTNITKDGSSEEPVPLDTFFARLQNLSLDGVLFSGICADTACNEVNKSCKLSVYTK